MRFKFSVEFEHVQCPDKKSAMGMTLGVPKNYWDPQSSFFVCLLCEAPKEKLERRTRQRQDDQDTEKAREQARKVVKSQLSLETCLFYGE